MNIDVIQVAIIYLLTMWRREGVVGGQQQTPLLKSRTLIQPTEKLGLYLLEEEGFGEGVIAKDILFSTPLQLWNLCWFHLLVLRPVESIEREDTAVYMELLSGYSH